MKKKAVKATDAWRLPAWTEKAFSKGKIGPGQRLFRFKGNLFLAEKWGYRAEKGFHIGLQALKNMEAKGQFLALASYTPLEKRVEGLGRAKPWLVSVRLNGGALSDGNNSVKKRLVRMLEVQATGKGVKALVAKPVGREASFWKGLGFSKVEGTNLFAKKLKAPNRPVPKKAKRS